MTREIISSPFFISNLRIPIIGTICAIAYPALMLRPMFIPAGIPIRMVIGAFVAFDLGGMIWGYGLPLGHSGHIGIDPQALKYLGLRIYADVIWDRINFRWCHRWSYTVPILGEETTDCCGALYSASNARKGYKVLTIWAIGSHSTQCVAIRYSWLRSSSP